jgi:hypothetical protein
VTATFRLEPDEEAKVAEILAGLHAHGYRDVDAHGALRPGVRIRHVGHQWCEAINAGTGFVVAITEKPDSAWSRTWGKPDVELITVSDKPFLDSRLSQLAQYHVVVIGGAA